MRRAATPILVAVGAFSAAACWLWLQAQPPPLAGRLLFGRWGTSAFVVALGLGWVGIAGTALAVSRRSLFGWIFASLLGGMVWLLLELAAFVGISYPQLFGLEQAGHLGSHQVPHVDLRGEAPEDIAALWGLDRKPVPYHFRTDQRGFRNAEDRDAADIYCLGDSFLVAALVPWNETLVAHLEAAISRPVMSVSVVGTGPQEQAELLADAGVPLDGRLVLHFVYEGNDLVDSRRVRQKATTPAARSRSSFFDAVTRVARRWTQREDGQAARHRGTIDGQPYWFQWDDYSFRGLEGEIAPVLDALEGLRAHVEAAGGRYAVVLVPSKIRVLGPLCAWPADSLLQDHASQCGPLPQRVVTWAADAGVDCIDLTGALRQAATAGDVPYFPADTHWNAAGNGAAARALIGWDPVVRVVDSGR